STVASLNVWVNEVNAEYERELAVRFSLVDNTSIIYTDATTDPFSNPTSTTTSLTEVRALLSSQVGVANYDLGHVLLSGDTGGVAYAGVVCDGAGSANKGGGVSGVPTPLGNAFGASRIMHETGHQFGALHTFNDISSCSTNRTASQAYESGGGLTIMAYPVQCNTPIATTREVRFHNGSLAPILNYIAGRGGTCGTTMATGNTPPIVSGGPDRTIPRNTPFMLAATGSDPDVNDAASLSYVWEQIDAGGALYGNTNTAVSFTDAGDPPTTTRPIFRPFSPLTNPSRTFPSLTYILNNANVPPAQISGKWTAENLPNVTRTLNFRITLRDNRANGGAFADDSVTLNADGNSGPFLVTAPNTAVSLPAGSMQTVTWSVNNTNLPPVSCSNVKISLSTDGGNSFPYVLAASVPNEGVATVMLPSLTATVIAARIKVEAVGNIFFDISDANFTITSGPSCPSVSSFAPAAGNTGTSVKLYGTGLTGVTGVKFSNNVTAVFTVNSDT
ncbi:MAG: reprolysin-like metallopeptidase, partial [Planctomycetota bacterium]